MALAVEGLTGPAGAPLLRDVSLAVPAGRTHLVLGPIHSGKTLLLRHIVGLDAAESGAIEVDGERFDARGEPEPVLRHMRTRMGVVFEGSALLNRISVVENVELPLLEHTGLPAEAARAAARELLAAVGLTADEGATPAELGRAERRRVALARAVALRPPVLLIDEPTVGLDAHAAAEMDALIAETQARHGCGVLLLSHEVRHAFGKVERIYVMNDGRIVASGSLDELRSSRHPVVHQLLHRRGDA